MSSIQLFISLRGQTVEINDVGFFEDYSVGIPFSIDAYTLRDSDGRVLDWELTDDEEQRVTDAIWEQYDEDCLRYEHDGDGMEDEDAQ